MIALQQLFLLLALLLSASSAHDPSQEQLDLLPDFGNPKVARKLKCSACKMIFNEVYDAFRGLYQYRKSPKEYEKLEVIENLCRNVKAEFGLLMRNNKPTNDFSKNKKISRLTGNWINSFIETRCGEIISQFEDELIEEFGSICAGDPAALHREYCTGKYADCSEKQLLKEEL
eukprot:TRINITY_DN54097_c0_g1_i1.p1 TRINITY_DN54097_c0_g1~~TRINITY_DN54097_c0_g1_i1.p1  ORF type:complete len:173 (+),score=40.57 TRINITY_DN54097_c0_g1_i1:22-540(+)